MTFYSCTPRGTFHLPTIFDRRTLEIRTAAFFHHFTKVNKNGKQFFFFFWKNYHSVLPIRLAITATFGGLVTLVASNVVVKARLVTCWLARPSLTRKECQGLRLSEPDQLIGFRLHLKQLRQASNMR